MAEPKLPIAPRTDVCRRCCLPEDLLPIQQAAVIRSFPTAYATVVMGAGANDPLCSPTPDRSPALEHATYAGAMFAAVCIRLHQLLGRERPEPLGLAVGRQGDPRHTQVQLTLSRLSDQAERVAQTIMTCAPSCDWRAPVSHDQPSPHALAHLAIDEAAEHLRDAGSALLLDAPSLAVAGSGLFLKTAAAARGTRDLGTCLSGRGKTPGGIVRRVREQSW